MPSMPPEQAKERAGSYPLLTPVVESEGYDRHSLLLPGSQMDLIQVFASADMGLPWPLCF